MRMHIPSWLSRNFLFQGSRTNAAPFLTMMLVIFTPAAAAGNADTAVHKANVYIEAANTTVRAVESWERYASWVNMKTGPTGKERYISYGLYNVPEIEGLMNECRAVAAAEPSAGPLDQAMLRYLNSFQALAPVLNQAAAYYDSAGYETDKAAEGKVLHKKLVPLATSFMAERDQMLPLLRAFVRDVEAQDAAALEAKEGQTLAWRAAQVMLTLNRVMDTFPRDRPQQINADEMDQMMRELGPDTPGEKFDELIAGVKPPKNASIDVKGFNAALDTYVKAVETFDGYKGEAPEDFATFKPMPAQMRDALLALKGPLQKSGGREFEGAGAMVGQIVQNYFEMMNESQSVVRSRLRYLQ